LQDIKTAYVGLVHSNVQFNKYQIPESESTLKIFQQKQTRYSWTYAAC